MEQEKVNRVKAHSLLSVVSSNPVEAGKIHDLSLMDQAMGLHTIHIVFYYRSNPFNDGPMSSDMDNLRITLSSLLDQYPVVMGRLIRGVNGNWQVKCNDAGVRMVQARVSTTIEEWLRTADASEERGLTVWEDMPEDPIFWSPFRVQINNFKCGGLAIGLSCTHMLADVTSATLLIKSWAEVHSGKPLSHSPIFHLPSPPPPPSQNNFIPPFSASNDHPNNTDTKMGTATMKFSSRAVEKCLSLVQKQCPNATPFDILVALLWSRVARLQEVVRGGDDHKRALTMCLDSRYIEGLPGIPKGYFGNGMQFSVLIVDADNMRGGLGLLSDCIHQHIAGLKGEAFWSGVRWLEEHSKNNNGPFRMYGRSLTCISTEHMADEGLIYGAEFNKGEKPVSVSYQVGNVEGEGLILVMPSPEAGLGRIVAVTLPEEQIAELCKDEEILDLEPILLVSGWN